MKIKKGFVVKTVEETNAIVPVGENQKNFNKFTNDLKEFYDKVDKENKRLFKILNDKSTSFIESTKKESEEVVEEVKKSSKNTKQKEETKKEQENTNRINKTKNHEQPYSTKKPACYS